MGIWQRVKNVFHGDLLNRELNEEYEAHITEAIAQGRDPEEARRAFGPMLRPAGSQPRALRSGVARWVES
jgi:putative ABC transport system permease protein